MSFVGAALGPPARWLRRSRRARWVLTGTVTLGVIGALGLVWNNRPERPLPGGAGPGTPQEKKAAFIDYLVPYVRDVNADILNDRRRLLAIRQAVAGGGSPGMFDGRWLQKISADYGMELPTRIGAAFLDHLLLRVDIIPPSLVLAQAAEESGWGTSRFAQHGNNLFGLRAYNGTGLVPKDREAGAKFRVAAYKSVRDSIAEYVRNLNTSENYIELRADRSTLRRLGQPVSGVALAPRLAGYSRRGDGYVETILSIIRGNRLGRFDS